MPTVSDNLWALALNGRPIDASELAAALEEQGQEGEPDFRTCLLIRDSLDALSQHWGHDRLASWLGASPVRRSLHGIWRADLGPAGFPSLAHRVMDPTKPETVLQYFRELGSRVPHTARLEVGGSIALILSGTLVRHTEDIDVVDEIPVDIRSRHDLLNELAGSYGLKLTHFQSRYLPAGWRDRLRSLGRFGRIDVSTVDVYDVLLSKLFSARRKDRDDLRALAPQVDKQTLAARLRPFADALLAEPRFAENAQENWYIVYGEALPS